MNKNNNLTRINTGNLHENNPLGGVPIGQNNTVEEGETKTGNFVYSNRIFLDENVVSQYNLPKSLIGKSVADATKIVDNKFKGRNDKISQNTKNSMLSKIAEAQESMKPQEPEIESQDFSENMIDPSQMMYGGNVKKMALGGDTEDGEIDPTGIISSVPGLISMGNDFFGKSNIVSDPNNIQDLAPVKMGNEIGGGAVKGLSTGAQFGSSFGPLGTAIGAGAGALIGSIGGLIGGNKKQKAIERVNDKNAYLANKPYAETYAFGGTIDPSKNNNTVETNDPWQTKKIVKYQPGVTSGRNGDSGFYLYSKEPTDSTFNYKTDREFVKNSAMADLQKTVQWQNFMRNKNLNNKTDINLNLTNPITEEYAYGGKMKKYAKGGDYYENLKLTPRNTAPIESILDQTGLKSMDTTVPYTIGTQPKVDISNANRQFTPGPSTFDMLKFNAGKIGDYVNKNAGNIARYAPIAANALQLAQLKKPQGERLDRLSNRYKPEYVDEAALQNIADQTMNNTVNAISQSGASPSQIRASILASQLQRTKGLSDAYSQAAAQNRTVNDRAQTFNLGVDQVNLNQSNIENENNARNIGNYDTQKSRLLGQIGNDIGNIGKEQIYKKIAATTTGYNWLGEYIKNNPNATPTQVAEAYKKEVEDKTKPTKQALGGYLIKNKK